MLVLKFKFAQLTFRLALAFSQEAAKAGDEVAEELLTLLERMALTPES